ncbi:hypothetical protein M3G49_11230, partial [Micrococcus luteus]|nr:hypothetical protein [Micrococcus luteus]
STGLVGPGACQQRHALLHLVASRFDRVAELDVLREHLASLGVSGWRQEFAASTSEVIDLLDFTRQRRRSLLKNLLDRNVANVPVHLQAAPTTGSIPLRLAEIEGETHPAPFGLYQGVQLLGTISARDHSDIQSILDTGFALRVELEHPDGRDQLQITLLDPLDDRLF